MVNYIYIHVCCINNWKEVFNKLYYNIKTSGLYDIVKSIKCNVLSESNNVIDFFSGLNDDKLEVVGISNDLSLYETPTINLLYQHSLQEESDFNVLYLHTKGVKHNNNNINVNDWIDYLTYFNITKYETCINYLQDYDAVGVNLQNGNVETHYSGNFWWTKSQYIKKLTKCEYKNYNSPEFWLTETNTGKYLSLWNSNINHYSQRYEEHNYKK